MPDHATQAIASALQLEVKKDGLQQRQNGAWVLRLSVHPNDMPMAVMKAPMGTRFVCVLVEVNDDETPKEVMPPDQSKHHQPSDTTPAPLQSAGRAKPEKRLAQRAAILCGDPVFQRFIEESEHTGCRNEEDAADAVRFLCGINSRAEIRPGTPAAVRWDKLYSRFIAWRDVPAEVA